MKLRVINKSCSVNLSISKQLEVTMSPGLGIMRILAIQSVMIIFIISSKLVDVNNCV